MSFRKDLLSGSFWNILASFSGKFLAFFTSIIILKIFTVSEVGIFDYGFTLITTLIPLLSLNFGALTMYYLPKLKDAEKHAFTIIISSLGFIVLASILTFLLKNTILGYLGKDNISTYYNVILVTGILFTEYGISILVFQTLKKFSTAFICSVGQSVLLFALIALEVFLKVHGLIYYYRVTGLFVYYIISYLPFVAYTLFKVIKESPKFRIKSFKHFFNSTVKYYPIFIVIWASTFIVRSLIFKDSSETLGALRLLESYYIIPGTIIGSISLALIPLIQSARKNSQKSYEKLQKLMSIINLVLFILFIFSFNFFSNLIFGTKYAFVGSYYPMFIIGFCIYTFISNFSSFIMSFKDAFWKTNIAAGVGQIAFVIASIILPKTLVGYSTALLINGIVLMITFALIVKRIRNFVKRQWIFVLTSLALFLGSGFILTLQISALLQLIIGIVATGVIIIVLITSKNLDYEMIKETINFIKEKLMSKKIIN
ncbi:Polysaccharide biosynthesis protein [uncultured archaeon]|nr:Polysaccharide biosynthesis protein [uncultured archaeon]